MVFKTLVAYASKGGATQETAQIISEILRQKHGFMVDLSDLRKNSVNVEDYEYVVVGGGVRGGKVYGEALKFLRQDFGSKKVAFFVCCGDAGDPEKHEDVCKKYLSKILSHYPNLKPIATEAFGGRMKILGKTVFDHVDKDKISIWAETLVEKLKN